MSQKERIEALDLNINDIQSNIHNNQEGISKMFTEFQRLFETVISMKQPSPSNFSSCCNSAHPSSHDGDARRAAQKERKNRLEFPKFNGEERTELLNHVNYFFTYQDVPEDEKVTMAAF